MTTNEFVTKVNAMSEDEREGVHAKVDIENTVFIANSWDVGSTNVASLSNGSRTWHFYYDHNVPACVLKLMSELANDEYRGKFLILNGEPEDSCCNFFLIGDDGQLYPRCEDTLDELVKFACTKAELNELKEELSRRMQKAVDTLTVPLAEVAPKMEEEH